MLKRFLVIGIVLLVSFITVSLLLRDIIGYQYLKNGEEMNQSVNNIKTKTIRFVPVGDSYTIGLGVSEDERWPNKLTEHLKRDGIDIEIVSNPSVSGYATKDALDLEVPQFEELKPDFATLFIGANDNFQNLNINIFRANYQKILDRIQNALTNPDNLILITIPDYSKSPAGFQYGAGGEISESINKFNEVVKEEADKRNLEVVDLYPISQTMVDKSFYIDDGLHPSGLGYSKWEEVIYPVVYKKLKN